MSPVKANADPVLTLTDGTPEALTGNQSWKRGTIMRLPIGRAIAIAAVMCAVFATPALASAPPPPAPITTSNAPSGAVAVPATTVQPDTGNFTWGGTLKYRLYSRQWQQAPGHTVITSNFDCTGAGITSYTITLYYPASNGTVAISPGAVRFTCNKTLQYTWNGPYSGYYFFLVEKANNGLYIGGHRSVSYPMARRRETSGAVAR